MVNLDLILFLFFVAAVLIVQLAKRQRIPAPKQGFPEPEPDDFSNADWQKPSARDDTTPVYRNRSTDNDWGSGGASDYEPAPVPQMPKVSVRKPLPPRRSSASSLKPAYKAIQLEGSLPQLISAPKVAKRTSPFADHFRQKRSIQLAVIDRVVLGPCRANSPYQEHQ